MASTGGQVESQLSFEHMLRSDVSLCLAENLMDIMAVRRLRNSGREFMTNSTAHIGVIRQMVWFWRTYRPACRTGSFRVFLLRNRRGNALGYGALSVEGDDLLVTECVATKHRGRGYGRFILQSMIGIAAQEGKPLRAEILSTNEPSITLHRKAGFVKVAELVRSNRRVELHSRDCTVP